MSLSDSILHQLPTTTTLRCFFLRKKLLSPRRQIICSQNLTIGGLTSNKQVVVAYFVVDCEVLVFVILWILFKEVFDRCTLLIPPTLLRQLRHRIYRLRPRQIRQLPHLLILFYGFIIQLELIFFPGGAFTYQIHPLLSSPRAQPRPNLPKITAIALQVPSTIYLFHRERRGIRFLQLGVLTLLPSLLILPQRNVALLFKQVKVAGA